MSEGHTHHAPSLRPTEANPLPAVPLVESPFFDELIPTLGLSNEAERVARALHRDGIAEVDLGIEDIDGLRGRIAVAAENRYSRRHGKAYDIWQHGADDVRDLANNPKIVGLLREVFQREPFPVSTINTRVGTEQTLHADGLFRASVPRRFYATVWVALEDVDEDNGPLVGYPGTHKLPDYAYVDMGLTATDQTSLMEYYAESYDILFRRLAETSGAPRVHYTPKAGRALIWTAGFIHGGETIRDRTRTRFAQIMSYNFAGCLYLTELNSDPYLGQVWLRDVVDVRTGETAPQVYNGRLLTRREIEAIKPRSIDALERAFGQAIDRR